MAKRRYAQGDVQWFLPNKKKPFAYSTVAESDAIKSLLQEFGDLKAALMAGWPDFIRKRKAYNGSLC